jgi:hypothetical protein
MKRRGVVAASAGNHAQGVAYASSLLGIASTIIMPEGASIAGQGTIGLEILEDVPGVEGIIIPVGGGFGLRDCHDFQKEKPESEYHWGSVRSCSLCLFFFKEKEDRGSECETHLGRWDCPAKSGRDYVSHHLKEGG